MKLRSLIFFAVTIIFPGFLHAQKKSKLQPLDLFDLEYVSNPQISKDGSHIIYERNFFDIQNDRKYSNLWIVKSDGTDNRPITTGNHSDFNPIWGHDKNVVYFQSNMNGLTQVYKLWLDRGQIAKLSNTMKTQGGLSLSPNGKWLAFSMFVPATRKTFALMPMKPEGSIWNDPPVFIDEMVYRRDGSGYVKPGKNQLFVLSTNGGSPIQLTKANQNISGKLCWSRDSKSIFFSANLREDADYQPRNSELYKIDIVNNKIEPITERFGPDSYPVLSPDGKYLAYIGFDDRKQGYQVSQLYAMEIATKKSRLISGSFDRDVSAIKWSSDGKGLYFQFDEKGNTKVAHISLEGKVSKKADNIGGTSLGRPYNSGSFSVATNGSMAYTQSTPMYPADLAFLAPKGDPQKIITLNDDFLEYKKLGNVEEIWYKSSYDQRMIQGWIITPPDFDPSKKYPLILEIHGGPFANYGDRFSAELQLFAAEGFVVLYTNPRGSTSYGEEFGNLIHHDYPNHDYDDLMSGVDAVIEKGFVDITRLYVTGGSGGGVLTSWIVGHTDRFRAAVVAKPVINWYSFVLTADMSAFFTQYWFPGLPWEETENYMKRSPLSYVGNVTTPTMLLTGENDFRTPMSETEQYYKALKLNKVETAMVRIPGASHGIAARPSNLIAKVVYIQKWFEKYGAKN